jgi:hypothetical protein
LEEYARIYSRKVPLVVSKTLDYISKYFASQIAVGSQIDVWIDSHQDLPGVADLMMESKEEKLKDVFEKYPISVVVGCLYLYLNQLPNSVCRYFIFLYIKKS